MAANFSDPEDHASPDVSLAMEQAAADGPPLSKREKENRAKYQDDYDSLRHRFPGGMNKYERNWVYQLGLYLLLLGLALINLMLNFRMIDVYQDLLDQLEPLPETFRGLDKDGFNILKNNFSNLDDSGLCDIDHFSTDFEKSDLTDSILNVQRLVKAVAYLGIGVVFWVTFIIKAMSHYNLCTEDFSVIATETLEQRRKRSVNNQEEVSERPNQALANIIKVKGGTLYNQETQGELKIRTYLRSDTVLFGLNQVLQDMPMATACILYFLFLLSSRGILCYEQFTKLKISDTFDLEEADPVVFAQLTIIVLNIFANMVINLAPRWIAFFNHQTVKHSLRPMSTTVRIFNLSFWVGSYLLAIFLPLFIVLYTPIGSDVLGLATTDSLFILVLIIFSAVCLGMGAFLLCCHWGAKFSEGIFIFSTLFVAFELGCQGCFEVEVLGACQLC